MAFFLILSESEKHGGSTTRIFWPLGQIFQDIFTRFKKTCRNLHTGSVFWEKWLFSYSQINMVAPSPGYFGHLRIISPGLKKKTCRKLHTGTVFWEKWNFFCYNLTGNYNFFHRLLTV